MIPYVKPGINLGVNSSINVHEIIRSGKFCLGDYTNKLEEVIKLKYNVKYAVACCNATNGLIIAFKAAGIKNMRVGIPSFTWPSTLYALECNNNVPVFFDIDKDSWTIDVNSNDEYVDAYIAVDTFGNPANIVTEKPIIYDAAHSFGTYNIGNRGIVEVLSFSFTKPITGMQGGMILTNDENVHEEAKELVRLSAKICEINAFVCLKSKELYVDKLLSAMRIMNLYKELIKIPFKVQEYNMSGNYSTFAILLETTEKRDNIYNELKDIGIETKIYYEPLVKGFKNTDDIYSRILCLPVYVNMISEISKICKIINEV